MERPVAAELSIARETSTTYHVMYRRRDEPGGAVTPWSRHGRDTLQVFLQQFESAGNVDRILTRVEAGLGYELDWATWTKSASRASSATMRTARLQASSAPWPSERRWQ